METSFFPAWEDGYEPALSPAGELSGEDTHGPHGPPLGAPGPSVQVPQRKVVPGWHFLALSLASGDDELELAR